MLAITTLGKSFGGVRAVDGISLTLSPGEVLGVIGPNGSGKSTLINLISGYIRSDRGKVELEGRDISAIGAAEVRRAGISRTFQNLRLLDSCTALENLKAALHLRFTFGRDFSPAWLLAVFASPGSRRSEKAATEAALDQLDLVGLRAHAHTTVSQLPYGLKKRLEIARVMLGDPRVILLDEPTAGLAPDEAEDLITLLAGHRGASGRQRGIILIEHHLEMVTRVCSRLVVMNEGKMIAEGPPSAVMRDPQVQRVYVGS